jgi:hypothetical protein
VTASPLDDLLLSTVTVSALEIAATRRDGEPLGTHGILAATIAVDHLGSWEALQIRATFVDTGERGRFRDEDTTPQGTWHNVPLTADATRALSVAARIARHFRLLPLPPGVLVLGLVWHARSGAARALLEQADVSHAELVELVQDEILGTSLEGLEEAVQTPPELASPSAANVEQRFADRALRRAGQLVAPGEEPDTVELLAAIVELADDPDLAELLDAMLLDGERLLDLRPGVGRIEREPAASARTRACDRFDTRSPDAAQLIVGLAVGDSPALRATLRRLALTPPELAAQIAEWRVRRDEPNKVRIGRAGFAVVVLNVLASVGAAVLIVATVLSDHTWWKLVFLLPVWWGHPAYGPGTNVVSAAVMGILVAPLVGIVHLVSTLLDAFQASAERQALWARTGVRLPLSDLRKVTRRLMSRYARRQQTLRQLGTAMVRGGGPMGDSTAAP